MSELNHDFQMSFQQITLLAPKVSKGIQIVLVISGKLKIETSDCFYDLLENDLLVLNRNQLYQMEGQEDNKVMILSISDKFMNDHYREYYNQQFECYSREIDLGREKMLNAIRKLLANMMVSYYRQDECYDLEVTSYICQLLLILIRGFKKKGSVIQKIDTSDKRLLQIIDYMERHYQRMLTLEEVAQKHFLSSSYLSRYFKQKMGMGFTRYLMNIRLKHSMKDLLYSDDSISQIAMNHGFPNVKSFTTLFKETYHMTPHEYRKTHVVKKMDSIKTYSQEDSIKLIQSSDMIATLSSLEVEEQKSLSHTAVNYESLNIDIRNQELRRLVQPDHLLIVSDIFELLKEDVRTQILEVKRDLRLKYIGIRQPISATAIPPEIDTDEPIPSISPYFNIDRALAFLKEHDLALFIRINYMDMTKDESSYFNKLTQFIKHCLQMYGEAFVSEWHVIFHEPHYTSIDPKKLESIYIRLYHVIKALVPELQIGVYMPFSFRKETTSAAHQWQFNNPDFIDFIGYHANQNELVDFEDMEEKKYELAKSFIKEKTARLKQYLKRHHIDKPIHLVSWNTLSGNTRYTNGTFFRGALILKNALDIANDIASMGLWINTTVHENAGEERRYRMDSLELFHYLKGKRPAYFALQFLNRLKGKIISQDDHHVMTVNERGYQLILMNVNLINPYLSIKETFLQKLNKEVRVQIVGLPPGEYQVRKHVFDKNHGALYTTWWQLNSKYGMDQEVIDYIIQTSRPSLEIYDEVIDGEWTFYTYLTTNAIHFFDIRKVF